MATIYKIAPRDLWESAVGAGVFAGAPVDMADGFIHFSTAAQVQETAEKHFAGQDDLVLAAFDDLSIGDVRYEAARGGELFPHLYGTLDPSLALWVKSLPLDENGRHVFPQISL